MAVATSFKPYNEPAQNTIPHAIKMSLSSSRQTVGTPYIFEYTIFTTKVKPEQEKDFPWHNLTKKVIVKLGL